MKSINDALFPAIWFDIFKELDADSRRAVSLVCKEWNRLIKDPRSRSEWIDSIKVKNIDYSDDDDSESMGLRYLFDMDEEKKQKFLNKLDLELIHLRRIDTLHLENASNFDRDLLRRTAATINDLRKMKISVDSETDWHDLVSNLYLQSPSISEVSVKIDFRIAHTRPIFYLTVTKSDGCQHQKLRIDWDYDFENNHEYLLPKEMKTLNLVRDRFTNVAEFEYTFITINAKAMRNLLNVVWNYLPNLRRLSLRSDGEHDIPDTIVGQFKPESYKGVLEKLELDHFDEYDLLNLANLFTSLKSVKRLIIEMTSGGDGEFEFLQFMNDKVVPMLYERSVELEFHLNGDFGYEDGDDEEDEKNLRDVKTPWEYSSILTKLKLTEDTAVKFEEKMAIRAILGCDYYAKLTSLEFEFHYEFPCKIFKIAAKSCPHLENILIEREHPDEWNEINLISEIFTPFLRHWEERKSNQLIIKFIGNSNFTDMASILRDLIKSENQESFNGGVCSVLSNWWTIFNWFNIYFGITSIRLMQLLLQWVKLVYDNDDDSDKDMESILRDLGEKGSFRDGKRWAIIKKASEDPQCRLQIWEPQKEGIDSKPKSMIVKNYLEMARDIELSL